jgi:hypothetical protein
MGKGTPFWAFGGGFGEGEVIDIMDCNRVRIGVGGL